MAAHHFLLLASLFGFVSSSNECHACFEGDCFSKTSILNNYKFSGQLAIDRTANIVYFHYEDQQSVDYTAAFDLDDIRFEVLPNIDFSFARAVDQTNRDVYFGHVRGIYKYNPISNTTTLFGLSDKTIWHMQYKNKLYYTVLNSKGLFTYENRQPKSVGLLSNYTIDDFIIDNRQDIYFLSQSKVYRLKKGANQATYITNDIYSLSVDKFEVAHFVHVAKRALFKLSKTDELVEVGAFGSGLPLKFVYDNNNNLVYHEHNSRKLYYLMPNYGRCTVIRGSHGKKHKKKAMGSKIDTENASTLYIHRIVR